MNPTASPATGKDHGLSPEMEAEIEAFDGMRLNPVNVRVDTVLDLPTFEINLSGAWDSTSDSEIFAEALRKLGFYRPGLLYCGFDNARWKRTHYSNPVKPWVVFANTEEGFEDPSDSPNNPLFYALGDENGHPAVIVYDPAKVQWTNIPYEYLFTDPHPYVGMINIRL